MQSKYVYTLILAVERCRSCTKQSRLEKGRKKKKRREISAYRERCQVMIITHAVVG